MATKAKPKRKIGRPKKEIDLKTIEGLARIGCTMDEMADVIGCARQTLYDRKNSDPNFLDAIRRGSGHLKKSLRRWMLANAEKGNASIQIFLAKNYIHMSDNPPPVPDDNSDSYYLRFDTSRGAFILPHGADPNAADTTAQPASA